MRRVAASTGNLKEYITEIPPALGKSIHERSSVLGATGKSVIQVCYLDSSSVYFHPATVMMMGTRTRHQT